MRKLRIPVAIATVTLAVVGTSTALAGVAATGVSGKLIGSFAGRAVVQAGGSGATITATGVGKVTPIGAAKLAGKGVGGEAEPCPTWFGTGTMTGAGGSISFKVIPPATSCPGTAQPSLNTVRGKSAITGGTGKYKKAKGTFTFLGTYDRGTGKFTVKFTGAVSY